MISIQNFSFRFRGNERYALHDVSLDIAEGDFVVLAGPSGCGKSTLALALGGFLFNQYDGEAEGEIRVGGLDARRAPVYDVAESVGLVQQNPEAQFCTLTVQDEVAFGLENRCLPRAEIRERMAWALDIVGARHLQERPLASLSGGEKQRVAVASVMAARPRVLIFDEPTSNLDPPATAQLFDVIARIRAEERITVIVIEHKTAYLERFHPHWLWLEERLTEAKKCWSADSADLNPFNPFNPLRKLNGDAPLLKVSGLSAGYNGKAVLHDVSVEVGPGEFVAVMGDNGSGKTTFLQSCWGCSSRRRGRCPFSARTRRRRRYRGWRARRPTSSRIPTINCLPKASGRRRRWPRVTSVCGAKMWLGWRSRCWRRRACTNAATIIPTA
jgi:energy-coupling factor transport system ATP-binding protein